MKRILITGKDSYIGTSFESWVSQWPERYKIVTVNTITDEWKRMDFSSFDTVLHVAAIVHKKERKEMTSLYMKVNCDLPFSIAEKAKLEGVKQFVFMSSMNVYGLNMGIVSKETPLNPKTLYGKSKSKAEQKLKEIESNNFNIVIIRPPMVYGKQAKGNYGKLAKVAKIVPLFPDIKNQRSMIFIDNLCELIRLVIDNEERGTFFPQNKEYVQTTELVKNIAEVYGKRIHLVGFLNPLINFGFKKVSYINKIFGNLVYEKELSDYQSFKYCIYNIKDSILKTEGR